MSLFFYQSRKKLIGRRKRGEIFFPLFERLIFVWKINKKKEKIRRKNG